MKIERLVLGTSNPGKLSEWSKILQEEGFRGEIVGVSGFGDIEDPDETGETFDENARHKATYYAKLIGEYILSEDGGYEVDVLDGAPGVHSKRVLPGGKEGTDEQLIEYVLEKVKGLPADKRGVSLTVAAAVSDPEGNIVYEDKEEFRGLISNQRGSRLIPGYPFRTIHYLPDIGKTYADLTPEEHKKYSHKRKIAKRLVKFLLEYI